MFKKVALAAAISSAFFAAGAQAGTLDSSSFTVQANITGSCSAITPSVLDFGDITNTTGVTNNATGSVQVTCSDTLPYRLAVSYGQGGTFNNRYMNNGAVHLNYQLYADAARTQVLGDNLSLPATHITGTGNGSAQTVTIYGQIPAQSTPVTGTYTDTVIATVIW